MKKKLVIGAVILVIIAGAILGFSLLKKGKVKGPQYRTETVVKGDIESLVVTSGTINPVDIIDIGSQVSGKIVKLYADFNSQVKAGQVVAELDQEMLKSKVEQNQASYQSRQASLEQAKVNLENAKKKWDRTQDLFGRSLVSFEEKETAEANYIGAKVNLQTTDASLAQQKAALDQSRVDLSYAIIRSPIDGTVITRSVNLGQTVAASLQAPVLFKVASDLSKMQVKCSVDEADIGRVKEGQAVRFTVDAFQGEVFNGAIRQVRNSPTTTQNVVTYETIIDTTNPDLKLKPGMTATVSIITGQAKAVVKVPNVALRFTPNLKPEELQKILADARAAMQGQRQGQPGQPEVKTEEGAARSGERQGRGQGQNGQRQGGGQGARMGEGVEMTPEMIQRIAQARARRGGGQVWIQDETGKIKPIFLRTGVTDNSYSELLSGELKEGMKVILGEAAGGQTGATNQQRGPGGMPGMMFMGGGR
jgi:HlyD family secretion protein